MLMKSREQNQSQNLREVDPLPYTGADPEAGRSIEIGYIIEMNLVTENCQIEKPPCGIGVERVGAALVVLQVVGKKGGMAMNPKHV